MEGGKQRMNNQISHLTPGSSIAELLPSSMLCCSSHRRPPGAASLGRPLPQARGHRAPGPGCAGCAEQRWLVPAWGLPHAPRATACPPHPPCFLCTTCRSSQPHACTVPVAVISLASHMLSTCFLPNVVCPAAHLSLSLVLCNCC